MILIILIASLFRFFKIWQWLIFGMDQEYEALLIKNILSGTHLPLIGVNASDTGLYLGPLFIYAAGIPYAIFSGSPLGGAITASILGVVVSILIYILGKQMFSKRIGSIAAILYAASFLTSYYDRQFWNPSPVPLMSLLLGYCLYKILKNHPGYIYPLALIFGLILHVHLSLLIFTPLIALVLWKKRHDFTQRHMAAAVGILVLLQTPQIIFEFRHDFTNLMAAKNLLLSNTASRQTSTFKERNTLFFTTLGRFIWVSAPADLFVETGQCQELNHLRKSIVWWTGFIAIASIAYFLYAYTRLHRKKRAVAKSWEVTFGILALSIVFVLFYKRNVFEYYFLFLFPWLSFIFAIGADAIWKLHHGKYLVFTLMGLIIIANLITLFTSSYSYSYKDKISAIEFSKEFIANKLYALEAIGECPRFGGYRYLYEYYSNNAPVSSYMDSYFDWLYERKNTKPDYMVLLSLIDDRMDKNKIKERQEEKLRYINELKLRKEATFGKIHVSIFSLL